MLPGDAAIVAPVWVPWSERVQPGDLRPGDLFPTHADDPRLEPGFTDTGAPEDVLTVVEELGLGRERVLSPLGREDAAERWYGGDFGPSAAIACSHAASTSAGDSTRTPASPIASAIWTQGRSARSCVVGNLGDPSIDLCSQVT